MAGERFPPKKMSSHLLYLGVSRPLDATLKRWRALQIRFGLVIFKVLYHVTHMSTQAATAKRVFE